ncbi:MAG: DUF4317 domain-containing protein [Lachnospiraceae bacterium]|nr:DUF4317 domain-containing protein [Lachnospiraceae bacterium]
MAKRDIMELQKRMRTEEHNITWIATALIELDGTVASVHKERLVSMREEEYFKYLDKIKSIFPYKKYGDAVLQVDVQFGATVLHGYMSAAINSEMKDDEAIQQIIEIARAAAASETKHAVIIWNDIYDIIKVDKNNESLDESEETLNYIGCMVCPVNMDREGLAYSANDEKFVAKDREWIMGAPEFAFMWPSFTDRSVNEDAVTIYTNNPANPPHDFIASELGCKTFWTRTEVQKLFEHAVLRGVDEQDDQPLVLEMFNYKLEQMADQDMDMLDESQMAAVLEFAGVKAEIAQRIAREYAKIFNNVPQSINDLYVKKYATKYAAEMKLLEIKRKLNQAADAIDNMSGGRSEELTQDIRRVAAGL